MNTPESELFHKGSVVYGLDKARAAIAREDRACIVEGNTDVIALRQAGLRAGRREHGHGADRAAAEGARAAEQAALARVRRRRRGRDRDAARDGARGAAGLRRQGRRAAARRRPGRRSERLRARGSPTPSRTSLYRVRIEIERADDREAAFRVVQGAARRGARLAGAPGRLAVRERQARHDRAAARGRRSARAAAAAVAAGRSMRARSSSATRSPACSRTPRSGPSSPS